MAFKLPKRHQIKPFRIEKKKLVSSFAYVEDFSSTIFVWLPIAQLD
jgi:hypothetical protein